MLLRYIKVDNCMWYRYLYFQLCYCRKLICTILICLYSCLKDIRRFSTKSLRKKFYEVCLLRYFLQSPCWTIRYSLLWTWPLRRLATSFCLPTVKLLMCINIWGTQYLSQATTILMKTSKAKPMQQYLSLWRECKASGALPPPPVCIALKSSALCTYVCMRIRVVYFTYIVDYSKYVCVKG